MTGTLYQHTETGEIYILMEINPKENTWFVFRNIRTLQEAVAKIETLEAKVTALESK